MTSLKSVFRKGYVRLKTYVLLFTKLFTIIVCKSLKSLVPLYYNSYIKYLIPLHL